MTTPQPSGHVDVEAAHCKSGDAERLSPRLIKLRALGAWVLCASLAACGGGGGDAGTPSPVPSPAPSTPSPPPPPPADNGDSVIAERGQVRVMYRPAVQDVDLFFQPAFGLQYDYRIDKLSGGVWSAATTRTGSDICCGWQDTSGSLGEAYRVVALLPGRDVILKTVPGTNQAEVRADLAGLAIAAGGEPLSGQVRLGLPGVPTGAVVTWVMHSAASLASDWRTIGDGNGADSGVDFDASSVSDGPHLVRAIVQLSASSWVEVRRQVSVDDPHFTGSAEIFSGGGTSTVLWAFVSSEAQVTGVQAFVDGRALGVMTYGETACTRGRGIVGCHYLTIDDTVLGSGAHQFSFVATDARGLVREWSQSYTVNSAPGISFTNPGLNTALPASGLLVISGEIADDSPAVTGTLSVDGAVLRRDMPKGPFAVSIDLSAYALGVHTIDITATDSQGRETTLTRRLLLQPSTPFTYQRVVDGDLMPYNWIDGAVVLTRSRYDQPIDALRFGPQSETIRLQNSASPLAMWISQGAGIVLGQMYTPLSVDSPRLIRWGRDGVPHDYGVESGLPTSHSIAAADVAGNWAAWSYRAGSEAISGMVLKNLVTGERHSIPMPSGMTRLVRLYEVASSGDSARLIFDAAASASAAPGFFVYEAATRQSRAMSVLPPGTVRSNLQTDGNRLLWTEGAASINPTYTGRLMAESLANPGEATVLSAAIYPGEGFAAGDGLVAWIERSSTDGSLNLLVNDGSSTTNIAVAPQSVRAAGAGAVAYTDIGNRLHLWTRATGSRLVYGAGPSLVSLQPGALYFYSTLDVASPYVYTLYRVEF